MPTLCLDDSFTKMERTILHKTFKNNCRLLGIETRDATIAVRRAPIGHRAHLGAITKIAPDYYVVLINSLNDIARSIFCIGHELVHFDQYSRGDLIDDVDQDASFWKGRKYTRDFCEDNRNYDNLPWEIEAAEKHDWLMDSAVRCLDRSERIHLLGVLEQDFAMAA